MCLRSTQGIEKHSVEVLGAFHSLILCIDYFFGLELSIELNCNENFILFLLCIQLFL